MTYFAYLSYSSSSKVLIVAVWYLVNMTDKSLKLRINQPIRSQLLKYNSHSSLSRGIAYRASYMAACSFFLPEKCALHPHGLTGRRKEVRTLVKRRDLGSELPSGPVGDSWEAFGADEEESVHPLVALMRDKSLSWTSRSCPGADGLVPLLPFLANGEKRERNTKICLLFFIFGICKHFALRQGTNVWYYLVAIKVKAFFIGRTGFLLKPGCRVKPQNTPIRPSRRQTNCSEEADLS